ATEGRYDCGQRARTQRQGASCVGLIGVQVLANTVLCKYDRRGGWEKRQMMASALAQSRRNRSLLGSYAGLPQRRVHPLLGFALAILVKRQRSVAFLQYLTLEYLHELFEGRQFRGRFCDDALIVATDHLPRFGLAIITRSHTVAGGSLSCCNFGHGDAPIF